jgi:hypothetical protein
MASSDASVLLILKKRALKPLAKEKWEGGERPRCSLFLGIH